MIEKIPSGWQLGSLDQITKSSGGGTPSKVDASFWVGGTIPWVSPKDMKSFVIEDSEDTVTELALDRLTLVPVGSVLMVVRSGILSRTLPVAITSVPVTVNQDMRAFTPETGVSTKYVAWQLIANERELLNACSKHGTTVASMEGPALSRFPLQIAPATEQTRIVAKLEELLSDLDAGVAELKAAQKKLAQYRQSLLKAAVEGALTQAWRAQNPPTKTGAQLLQRILQERRARWEAKQLAKIESQGKTPPKDWQKKYPEPVQPDIAGLPELPQGWVWASVDQLAFIGTGVTPLRSKRQYFDGGDIPWVTSGALNDEFVTCATQMVTSAALDECRLELYPAGSLLVAMYGEGKTRGKCSELSIAATINQAIAALVFEGATALACKPYLKSFLLKSYDDMRGQASGGVQPNLNLQIIRAIPVPIPPLLEQAALQDQLAEKLESAHRQLDAIVFALKQSAAQRQNILRAAFSGQLVPQDPSDEPAEALLARIRAERATAAKPSKTRKPRTTKEPA